MISTSGPIGNSGAPTTLPTAPAPTNAYYLIESNGAITGFGGAGSFGSKAGAKLSAPVIGGGATADGGGYWIVTAKGNVYNYGDAPYYGAPVHDHLGGPIVAFAATADGQGYWLVDANGAVYNYGDAPFCGSAVHTKLKRPIVAFAPSFDSQGYYLTTTTGITYAYGDAYLPVPTARQHPRHKVVAIAPTPNGGGYWLAAASGAVDAFGDAALYGNAVHAHPRKPIVSFEPSPDGLGYYVATNDGRIYNFGDAPFYGSLAKHRPRPPVTVVAIIRAYAVPAATVPAIPHHVFGYDISNYQCAKSGSSALGKNLPSTSGLTIIEAAGWLDSADNSCLAAEASWATAKAPTNATPYHLYLFVNSPGTNSAATSLAASGPKGTCGTESGTSQQICIAYNYGYNGARAAYAYALGKHVTSPVWWLDVENSHLSSTDFSDFSASEFWSASKTSNDETIQGALDALRQEGVDVGIYSTSVQYPLIAGSFVPVGETVPLWIAGAPWTNPPYTESNLPNASALTKWCAGSASYSGTPGNVLFAGGVPWMLQETPGLEQSPDNLDPDYTC